MRTILRFVLVLVGCLHLCGGHYGVLQIVAWSGMIVEYSGENGLIRGAIQTFDGEHPCELCLSINEAKKEGNEQPAQGRRHSGFELKNLLVPEITSLDPSRPKDPPALAGPDPEALASLIEADPAVPPPRINQV